MISVERQYQNTIDELTADIANLRAGHCLAVIPETLVDCGEGGNYCSEACRLRALNALAQELETKRVTMLDANRAEIVRLDTLVADMRSAGDETLAARERDHAERALARVQAERDRILPVAAAAETWAMEREPQAASAHALSEAVLAMRADRRESVASNSSCECAARGSKHASFCPAKES